jgi:hypothetical protein
MRERNKAVLITLCCLAMVWALVAWIIAPDFMRNIWPSVRSHQLASLGVLLALAVALLYVLKFQDEHEDQLIKVTLGHRAFERDGVCFWPLVRVQRSGSGPPRAEISLYYQARYSGLAEVVFHMRPEDGAFFSHRGGHDIHFAFHCDGGGYGVVHQPIAVPREFQGRTVGVRLAAAVRYPRSRGTQVRSRCGTPVGTFDVDWALAYRQSRHELCGEIEMVEPANMHLTLPEGVKSDILRGEFIQETLAAAG